MQEKLRATVSLLRGDLHQQQGKQTHFDTDNGDSPYVSTLGIHGYPTRKPKGGYFYIQQPPQPGGQSGSLPEGTIGTQGPELLDGFSVRMNTPLLQGAPAGPAGANWTAFLPALCFTNNRRGNQPQDYFMARIPGTAQYTGANSGLLPFSATEQQFFNYTVPRPPQPSPAQPGPAMLDYQQPVPAVNTTPAMLANPPVPMRTGGLTDQQSGFLISPWSEIGYFLVPTGRTAGTTTPMPTYSLRRRLRVVVNDQTLNGTGSSWPPAGVLNTGNARIPASLWGTRYGEVSCLPDTTTNGTFLYFNNPADLSNAPVATAPAPALPQCPVNNVGGCQVLVPPLLNGAPQQQQQSLVPLATGQPVVQGRNDWAGDDIILTDVISFNVRVLAFFPNANNGQGQYANDFLDLTDPSLVALPQPGFYNTATPPLVLSDPNNPNSPLVPSFTISALEITIRVWDVKTSQTRQVTLIQEM